jgi:hypothetical protein
VYSSKVGAVFGQVSASGWLHATLVMAKKVRVVSPSSAVLLVHLTEAVKPVKRMFCVMQLPVVAA